MTDQIEIGKNKEQAYMNVLTSDDLLLSRSCCFRMVELMSCIRLEGPCNLSCLRRKEVSSSAGA